MRKRHAREHLAHDKTANTQYGIQIVQWSHNSSAVENKRPQDEDLNDNDDLACQIV
jgi:hypothetical protein